MSERFPDAHIGAQNLLYNRLLQAQSEGVPEIHHTPPSYPHYHDSYYWDAVAHAMVSAEAAVIDPVWLPAAKNEMLDLIEGIQPNGDLPNIRFADNTRKFDPERMLAFEKGAKSSNYTQPPVLALGVRKVYESINTHDAAEAKDFLTSVYDQVRSHYEFLHRELRNDDNDWRIGIYHPHMTGRDSDPTFDGFKTRIPRFGPKTPKIIDKLNIPLDYVSVLRLGMRLKKAKGDYNKMREIYWVNDVMMNCIYVDNLREMAELSWETGHIEDAWMYMERAEKTEQNIVEKMWFQEERNNKGAFMATNADGEKIKEVSVSNLFPVMLPNLEEEKLRAIINVMDVSFNVNFPLPSVATHSRNYDPNHNESDRIWRGSTWMITNWMIVRGLRMQASRPDLSEYVKGLCTEWADRIAHSSRKLVDKSRSEFYNPNTGVGQRPRVHEFGWSNLGYIM